MLEVDRVSSISKQARRTTMLLKHIMTSGMLAVQHEPGRQIISATVGISHPRAADQQEPHAGRTRRAIRPSSHIHRLGRARGTERRDPEFAKDCRGVAGDARGVTDRARLCRGVKCFCEKDGQLARDVEWPMTLPQTYRRQSTRVRFSKLENANFIRPSPPCFSINCRNGLASIHSPVAQP